MLLPGRFLSLRSAVLLATSIFIGRAALADEGLWLFNEPPAALLEENHHFALSAGWLEHTQQSSVRFGDGTSGAFLSADGLLITTYHVGAAFLGRSRDAALRDPHDSFHAATLADEKPCPGLMADVLQRIEDVTEQVRQQSSGEDREDDLATRASRIAEIEKKAAAKSDLHCRVVPLYGGARFHLYTFKRYSDLRLVFAPEKQAAYFEGNGHATNQGFDVCFLRAYENGKPAHPLNFLKWSARTPAENDLVFVSGNPQRTQRLLTCTELEYLRDSALPFQLRSLNRQQLALEQWSASGPENTRRASDSLAKVRNRREKLAAQEDALLDPGFMLQKRAMEKKLREAAAPVPELQEAVSAWDRITVAQRAIAGNAHRCELLEGGMEFNLPLFEFARLILRSAMENSLPNAKRLPEYRDTNRPALEQRLFSDEPIDEEVEIVKLTDRLSWLAEELGSSEFGPSGAPEFIVHQALGEHSPRGRAGALVKGTGLKEAEARKMLYAAGFSTIAKTADPMIEFARALNPEAQRLRGIREVQEEIKQRAYDEIAAAKFLLKVDASYPDGTSTPRFSFGVVRGYEDSNDKVSCQTTLGSLFDNTAPSNWTSKKERFDLTIPFTILSTADIAGGFPGAAVLNQAGEFAGIVTSGNAAAPVLDLAYDERQSRSVSLTAKAVVELLRHVYGASKLAAELESGHRLED